MCVRNKVKIFDTHVCGADIEGKEMEPRVLGKQYGTWRNLHETI